MSKKILVLSLTAILLLSACEQTGTNETPTTDSEPTTSNDTQITGVATIGLFGGTEMGCEYGEMGSSVECNTGSGTIYLKTTEGEIYLKEYTCPAIQLYINDESGKRVEYKASGACDNDIVIGETYTATGELTVDEGVWRNGKQVDEQWLMVDSITQAK